MNRLQMRSNKIYKELSSGKRINRPSDDPFGTLQATGLTTHKRLLDQYSRNIDTARINLYAADNALNQAVSIMTEARTTTISAISVLGDGKSHKVMADSISQLKEQLFNLAKPQSVGDPCRGLQRHVRKPVEQSAKSYHTFHPRQRVAHANMDAKCKTQVPVRTTPNVKNIRVRKLFRVAICRRDDHVNCCACG